MDAGELLAVVLSLTAMLGGVVVILAGLRYRAQVRELRHKERLALIERGMMPPPEFDPQMAFNRGLKQRSLSFGIIVVGLGVALMFVIGVAGGALDVGVGIGGAVAILGTAFIVRSIFAVPADADRWPERPPPISPPGDLPKP